MKIEVKNFGTILVSRPAGKDAFLSTNAYVLSAIKPQEEIIIDFAGVNVLTPSWADEFVTPIKEKYVHNKIVYLNDDSSSIKRTLAIINKPEDTYAWATNHAQETSANTTQTKTDREIAEGKARTVKYFQDQAKAKGKKLEILDWTPFKISSEVIPDGVMRTVDSVGSFGLKYKLDGIEGIVEFSLENIEDSNDNAYLVFSIKSKIEALLAN